MNIKPRCIVCRETFNRAASEDKLRCKKCQSSDGQKLEVEWKEKLKKVKTKK